MKLIICGSRTITDETEIKRLIDKGLAELKVNKVHIDEVVSGGAKGPDIVGEIWAKENSIPVKQLLPDWSLGKRAGPLRNIEMCEYAGKDGILICIHDGESKGCLQCYNYAVNAGIKSIKYVVPNTQASTEKLS